MVILGYAKGMKALTLVCWLKTVSVTSNLGVTTTRAVCNKFRNIISVCLFNSAGEKYISI